MPLQPIAFPTRYLLELTRLPSAVQCDSPGRDAAHLQGPCVCNGPSGSSGEIPLADYVAATVLTVPLPPVTENVMCYFHDAAKLSFSIAQSRTFYERLCTLTAQHGKQSAVQHSTAQRNTVSNRMATARLKSCRHVAMPIPPSTVRRDGAKNPPPLSTVLNN